MFELFVFELMHFILSDDELQGKQSSQLKWFHKRFESI